mmetsp:Transcript_33153/g.30074  ORF Transcript_33153/g.30074 Transcript_33153/m.30074 type:complete len:126 (-) Transcript_33153:235-612(-)
MQHKAKISLSDLTTDIKLSKRKPRYIELPNNYQDFNTKYLTRKCHLCKNEGQTKNVLCVCLICGKTICRRSCLNKEVKLGNLTIHSFKHHWGNAAFLDINDLQVYLISMPKIAILPSSIYIDKFG